MTLSTSGMLLCSGPCATTGQPCGYKINKLQIIFQLINDPKLINKLRFILEEDRRCVFYPDEIVSYQVALSLPHPLAIHQTFYKYVKIIKNNELNVVNCNLIIQNIQSNTFS